MADATGTAPNTNEWPGAFGAFKPSLRTVAFNLWPFLITGGLSILLSLLPDAVKQYTDSSVVNTVIYIVATVASIIAGIATTIVLLNSADSKKVATEDTLRSAVDFTLKYIGLSIVSTVIIIVSLLLLIVPFFFVAPRISMATYFLINEKMGVIESLKASWNQTKGHVGKIYGIVGVNILMLLPIITIIGIPLTVFLLVAYSAASILLYKYIVTGKFTAPDTVTV